MGALASSEGPPGKEDPTKNRQADGELVFEVEDDLEDVVAEFCGIDAVHVDKDDDGGLAVWYEDHGGAGALLAASVSDDCKPVLCENAPTQAITCRGTVSGLLGGPHQVPRFAAYESVCQQGRREVSQVVGGGDEAAAGDFVAGIEDAGVVDGAGFVLVVPAGAVRDDREEIVGLGVVHGGGTKDIFAGVVGEFLRCGAFEDAADYGVAVSGVIEPGAGLGYERIVGENLQGFLHGGEMPGAVFGDVAFAVFVVMTDAAEVGKKLAGGDGSVFLREHRAIFLDGGVEIELAAIDELEGGGSGDGLGDGGEAEEGCGSCGDVIFEIGHAVAGGPGKLALEHDGGADSGDAVGGHEVGDGLVDGGAFFGREGALLGGGNEWRKKDEENRCACGAGADSGSWCHDGASGRSVSQSGGLPVRSGVMEVTSRQRTD